MKRIYVLIIDDEVVTFPVLTDDEEVLLRDTLGIHKAESLIGSFQLVSGYNNNYAQTMQLLNDQLQSTPDLLDPDHARADGLPIES